MTLNKWWETFNSNVFGIILFQSGPISEKNKTAKKVASRRFNPCAVVLYLFCHYPVKSAEKRVLPTSNIFRALENRDMTSRWNDPFSDPGTFFLSFLVVLFVARLLWSWLLFFFFENTSKKRLCEPGFIRDVLFDKAERFFYSVEH